MDSMKTSYLIIYNLIQTVGWSLLFIQTCFHLLANNASMTGLYTHVHYLLNIFQTMAILEVIHCLIRFVRSSPLLTGIQVASRLFITWAILYQMKAARNQIGLLLILFAWSITEIIRYSYYALALINMVPPALQWLRYSLFIVLYPMGVLGEMLCIYSTLADACKSRMWSIELPNRANFAFSYCYVLYFVLLPSYPPGLYVLYTYMLSQRKMALGGTVAASKKTE